MGYKRILVTLDGSKVSEQALKHVLRIADSGASIHLLSVQANDPSSEANALAKAVDPNHPATNWPAIPPIGQPTDPAARERYLHEVEDWLSQAEYNVSSAMPRGEVIDSILSTAKSGDYEIIVMVTHQKDRMVKTIVGSVTDAVIQQAPCPVLAIPADSDR